METPPYVTLVVLMRNEAGHIGRCLRSLLANDFPAEQMEILVVDGMSEDGSRAEVGAIAEQVEQPPIRILDNPERITPAGLNRGITAARGEIIMRIDGHSVFPADYIRRSVDALVASEADNVGGLWDIRPGAETPKARALARAQSHPLGVGSVEYRQGVAGPQWVDTVPFGCFRRDVFDRIGGFDPELVRNQDDELNARLIGAGGRILLDPAIRCTYYARPTLRQTARMFFQYGKFKPLAALKAGRVYTVRQVVPPAFVVGLLLLVLIAPFWQPGAWALAGVVALYLLALVGAALPQIPKLGARGAGWLPAAFAVMHFAYGWGAVQGIWTFLIRGRRSRDAAISR